MTNYGIDKATFYCPHYYLKLDTLAKSRGIDPERFRTGLGQEQMAVTPPDEGVVTMAANAAYRLIEGEDKQQIKMLLFATESGIDQSKSAGIFVHQLLGLSKQCRVVELKQACYSATVGIRMALNHIKCNPDEKVLVIASDIARYGLNTGGESSQGGGAVAMLLSANPRLVSIEDATGICVEDAMDFWRPNYRDEALVDGKLSCALYLKLLKETWKDYSANSNNSYGDIQHFCYHTPLPSLAEKAHHKLAINNNRRGVSKEELNAEIANSLKYSKKIGNCYSASLYLGLLSLLDNHSSDMSGDRIGFYSYGSGATAEFFSAVVCDTYREVLFKDEHAKQIQNRTELTQEQYEKFYNFKLPTDGGKFIIPQHNTGHYRLSSIDQHKRVYETIKET
jgi:hydroxymethylglutaryl-CoA synthase